MLLDWPVQGGHFLCVPFSLRSSSDLYAELALGEIAEFIFALLKTSFDCNLKIRDSVDQTRNPLHVHV